jgi:WD40 repeat protein
VRENTTGTQLLHITHAEVVRGVAFSPDGQLLATGSQDLTVQVWRLSRDDQG